MQKDSGGGEQRWRWQRRRRRESQHDRKQAMGRGVLLRISSRGGVTEMVNFAEFMKYGEKFEEKVQVVLRGVFVAKRKQGRRESW